MKTNLAARRVSVRIAIALALVSFVAAGCGRYGRPRRTPPGPEKNSFAAEVTDPRASETRTWRAGIEAAAGEWRPRGTERGEGRG